MSSDVLRDRIAAVLIDDGHDPDRRSGRADSPNPDAWWLEVLARAQTEDAAETTAAMEALAAVNGVHALRAAFAPRAASIESWEAAALAADPSIRPELADGYFELEVRGPILIALGDPQAADITERLVAELPFQDPIAATRLRDWVLAVRVSVAWDDEDLDER